jgi:hypothetical protein
VHLFPHHLRCGQTPSRLLQPVRRLDQPVRRINHLAQVIRA